MVFVHILHGSYKDQTDCVCVCVCSNLMAAVSLLAPPPPVGHASTVAEWLALLDLSLYLCKFEKFTLSKISTLWDVQLTSVSGWGLCYISIYGLDYYTMSSMGQ